MAGLPSFLPEAQKQPSKSSKSKSKRRKKVEKQPSSWDQIKNLLTCKEIQGSTVHDPSKNGAAGGYSKLGSCSSICSFRDVVHGNTRVVDRADHSPEGSTAGQEIVLLGRKNAGGSSSSARSVRSNGGGTYVPSSKGMQFRKLSGCYECHMIVDPSRLLYWECIFLKEAHETKCRYPSPRTRIRACSECGEVFPKIESLEHHQAIRHAVSELGPEDSGRNIVEIIFKSSWMKKDNPICQIERILKVHNTQRTIQRFEDCRDAVKIRAASSSKKNPRCAADGNELLRFHCSTLTCSLGARGSSNLCGSVPGCGVCTVIRHGFQGKKYTSEDTGKGVRTMASSGRAHDCLGLTEGRRAMLVCRVIAGKVRLVPSDATLPEEENSSLAGSYDSLAGYAGIYSSLEELHVFNPRAILPCFVVIYKSLES
ncbi:hypothetical protein RJ639_043391 [Escallonia herrerae]|uniref:C2H2-type domain-containing protein n=1 Tax=Escallonia herrerae TaxID=1293975 RepID=A0AA89B1E8_9ASTE|nr:hypothetical protein RJ639_043391 [Escallonia herrerae]